MLNKICGVVTFVGALSWVTLSRFDKDLVTVMGASRVFDDGLRLVVAMAAVYTLIFMLTREKK